MTPKLSHDDATVAVLAEVTSKRREHDAIVRTMGENLFTIFVMCFAFACIAMGRDAMAMGAIIVLVTDSIFTNVLRSRMTDLNRVILDQVTEIFKTAAKTLPPSREGEEWRRDHP